MRDLVMNYLNQDLSRHPFSEAMAAAGFTVAAAESVLQNFVLGPCADGGKQYVKAFEGNGGEVLAEQLLQTGIDYLFVGNGSGLVRYATPLLTGPNSNLFCVP